MSETSIPQRLAGEMKEAMKARNATALAALRALKSALNYAAIEKYGAEGELDAAESVAVVRKQIKQRQDSIESFEKAERHELAARERAEIAILEDFLPAAMGDSEVAALVEACIAEVGATSRKEMGAVMKIVQERAQGRADNKVLSREVMARLG